MLDLSGGSRPDGKVSRTLRNTLVMSHKEMAFKKVVQATMIRDRQHGPILELNRMFYGAVCTDHVTSLLT